jgi:bifunctional non-homologous end joining protein LigD
LSNNKNQRLLIKEKNDVADARQDIVSERAEDVSPGRTIDDPNNPKFSRQAARPVSRRKAAPKTRGAGAHAVAADMPAFVAPQLATLVSAVPAEPAWLHELKFDGYRILCRIENGNIATLTRNAQDWTDRFRVVAQAAKQLPTSQALIDGEVVAVEADGKPNFQLLQNSLRDRNTTRLIYYAFDLLFLDGRDLRSAPLLERKEELQSLLPGNAHSPSAGLIRYSEHWIGHGRELFAKACETGFEGIISKRIDDPYRSGRTRSWLKIKCSKSQEFVIGGFTDPAGARLGFGALLLGVHDTGGALRYAGRVGTGFDDQTLRDLRARLKTIERNSKPFAAAPRGTTFKNVHWVEPKLVGEVVFTGWTSDGLLRHPSFKGLREDKPAGEITREVAAPLRATAQATANGEDDVARVKLTHPDRVLYPDQGVTKRELAHYYEQVADWILPHLESRPLTIVRCPQGHQKKCFYQRHPREAVIAPIQVISVREKGKSVKYLAVDSLPGLIALVQMGALELHTWGSRAPRLEYPDRMIFDLDPAPDVRWEQIKQGAEHLRTKLEQLDFSAFVKTTGGKGLHVVVPIAPKQTWPMVKDFSRAIAESVVRADPDHYIATMSKAKRSGKIFVDYLRNSRTATAVSAYSTRARPGATVSMPICWEDLKQDLRTHFNVRNVPEHLARQKTDPWHGYEAARRPLTAKLLRQIK